MQVITHNEYSIEVLEAEKKPDEPARWRARIRCVDGAKILVESSGDIRSEIITEPDQWAVDDAIKLAKRVINAGGLLKAPEEQGE
jgi:hypothetical protein